MSTLYQGGHSAIFSQLAAMVFEVAFCNPSTFLILSIGAFKDFCSIGIAIKMVYPGLAGWWDQKGPVIPSGSRRSLEIWPGLHSLETDLSE